MIIIKYMISTLVQRMKHFTLNFGTFLDLTSSHLTHFQSLRWPLLNISTVTTNFFLTEIKTIPIKISFINVSKFHEFVFFLNRNLVRKIAFFPIYFIQKRLYWTHVLRSPPFHYNHGEVWFFYINILGIPWILQMQKFKKNSRSRFFKPQPAQASLIVRGLWFKGSEG